MMGGGRALMFSSVHRQPEFRKQPSTPSIDSESGQSGIPTRRKFSNGMRSETPASYRPDAEVHLFKGLAPKFTE